MLRTLVSILSHMPLGLHYWIADWVIYPLITHIIRYRRRLVERNIRNSFPDKSEPERKRIVRDFYHQLTYTIVETIYGFRKTNAGLVSKHVHFENKEIIGQCAREYGGCVVMLSHVGNWEWMASFQEWLQPDVTLLFVYRQLKSEAMDRLMLAIRGKREGDSVEKKRVLREMVRYRAEKKPLVLGLISDQKPRPEVTRTWLDFLHQDTGFLDGGEVLAKKFGYPVFCLTVTRPSRGQYKARFNLISMKPKETEEGEITTIYARALEDNIRLQPELWLWTHNRWKWKRIEN